MTTLDVDDVRTGPPATAPGLSAARGRRSVDRTQLIMTIAGVVTALAVVVLLLVIVWISIRSKASGLGPSSVSLKHYGELLSDPATWRAVANTAKFVGWTSLWAVLFGVSIAWVVERTDFRGRSVVQVLMTVVVLLPSFVKAIGWVFIAHPRIGLLNQFGRETLGIDRPVLDIATVAGMGWIEGLSLAAVVYLFTAGALRAINPALEEAVAMSGGSRATTLRKVTLPLIWPALLGAIIYITTIAIATLDVPLIVGVRNRIFVFSTFIYLRSAGASGVPNYGVPAAFGVLLIGCGLLLSLSYIRILRRASRYEVITGKGSRRAPLHLGRFRPLAGLLVWGYLLLAAVVPLATLVWASLIPSIELPSADAFGRISLDNFRFSNTTLLFTALRNSLILMVGCATLVVVLSLIFSRLTLRSKSRLRFLFEIAGFLPQAVPNVLFGLAAFLTVLYVNWPVDLYGSIVVMIVVMAMTHLAFGTRMTNAAQIQVGAELEEAVRTGGGSTLRVLRHVTLPLLRRSMQMAWLWVAVLAYRDLTIPSMLASGDNVTLSVIVWSLWSGGRTGEAIGITLVMVLVMLPIVVLYTWVGREKD